MAEGGITVRKTTGTVMRNNKLLCVAGLLIAMLGAMPLRANASSHREAPLITASPKVDGTDFYMFRSYEPGRDGFVTLIADYFPFQEPWGGPNYYMLDPNALYDIVIDNVGDGVPHLIFRFQFANTLNNIALNVGGKKVEVPLLNVGPVPGAAPGTNSSNVNVTETFTVQVINANGFAPKGKTITNASTGSKVFLKPTDNIGCKSYDASSPVRCADDDSMLNGSYARYACASSDSVRSFSDRRVQRRAGGGADRVRSGDGLRGTIHEPLRRAWTADRAMVAAGVVGGDRGSWGYDRAAIAGDDTDLVWRD